MASRQKLSQSDVTLHQDSLNLTVKANQLDRQTDMSENIASDSETGAGQLNYGSI